MDEFVGELVKNGFKFQEDLRSGLLKMGVAESVVLKKAGALYHAMKGDDWDVFERAVAMDTNIYVRRMTGALLIRLIDYIKSEVCQRTMSRLRMDLKIEERAATAGVPKEAMSIDACSSACLMVYSKVMAVEKERMEREVYGLQLQIKEVEEVYEGRVLGVKQKYGCVSDYEPPSAFTISELCVAEWLRENNASADPVADMGAEHVEDANTRFKQTVLTRHRLNFFGDKSRRAEVQKLATRLLSDEESGAFRTRELFEKALKKLAVADSDGKSDVNREPDPESEDNESSEGGVEIESEGGVPDGGAGRGAKRARPPATKRSKRLAGRAAEE